ncbi:MAG: TonB-dependent receptor [Tannerellaceae bacterium]|jgi:iron complex outermembrane receptor protein|nr:TonB-dependent receptor [Tannerellaceae bacterium]
MSRHLLLTITLLLPAFASQAAFPQERDSLIHLKEVVVTANKTEVNRNSVPLSISVIDRTEIDLSSESALLPVLTHRVPGLFVTQKGMTGFGLSSNSAGQVNIRGIGGGNKVLMLFDGQPQWAGVFGHSLPDTYVASDAGRVEVVRGPASLLYGSNAMGGVVNIITRRPQESGLRTQARIMYGSYNTQKYMANNSFSSGNFNSFISINHDRTNGHRDNSAFRITNGFANLGYMLSNNTRLTGSVSYADYKTNDPGPVDNPLTDHIIKATRGTASIGLNDSREKNTTVFQAFYNWGRHEINDGYAAGRSPRTFLFNSSDHNAGILLYETLRLFEGNSLTVGVDYKNWGGHAWNDSINGPIGEIVNRSVNEIAGYAIAQQSLLEVLTLNAGLRYEKSDAYGTKLTPQAGLTILPFAGNSIRLSYSSGYRSPNIRELYISYPPYSIANPDLRPESLQNYEIAVSQRVGNTLKVEAALFYIDAKDLIAGVQGKLTNVEKLTNKGFEIELAWHPHRDIYLTGNYSYLTTSRAIEAAPKNKVFVEATWKINALTLTADVESIGGLIKQGGSEDDRINYTLVDAKASYLFGKSKNINIFAKGENLTGTKYEILRGFPMPRATVLAGIEVTF